MAFMCRLSGHYKPRLMTIAAKRLRPHSPCSQPHLHVRVRLQLSSHRVPHRKPTDNDDNNRTFSHLQLKAGRVKGTGGGRGVRCGVCTLKSCCCICPLGALCVAPYKKTSSSALRVRFVSRSTSFSLSPLFYFFFCQFFIFCLLYDIFIFCSFDCIVYCSAP